MTGSRRLEKVSFKNFKRAVADMENSDGARATYKWCEHIWIYREYPDFHDTYGPIGLAALLIGRSSNLADWAKDPEKLQVSGFFVRDAKYLDLFSDILKHAIDCLDKAPQKVVRPKLTDKGTEYEEEIVGLKFISGYALPYPQEPHLHRGYLEAGFVLTDDRYEDLGTMKPDNTLSTRQSENFNASLGGLNGPREHVFGESVKPRSPGTSSTKKKSKIFDDKKAKAPCSDNLPDKRDIKTNVKRWRYTYPVRFSIEELAEQYKTIKILPQPNIK